MTPGFCEEHGLTDPCNGCRADQLAARGEVAQMLIAQGVPRQRVRYLLDRMGGGPDVRTAAAGEGGGPDGD